MIAWGSGMRGAAACGAAGGGALCRVGAGREDGAGWRRLRVRVRVRVGVGVGVRVRVRVRVSRRTLMNICVVRLSVPLVANEM